MRTKLATWLLVVLVAGGAVSALAARSRGKTKLLPAAKDSVLQIPRVTRAPELDKYLGSQPTAPGPTAGAEDKKKTKAKGESKARPDSTAAKEKDQADPGAKEGGNTETKPRSDTPSIHLDGVLDSLEKRLHRLESRIDTPATRPANSSAMPPPRSR